METEGESMTHVLYDNESLALGKATYERYWQCKHGVCWSKWDDLDNHAKASWIAAAWAAIDFKAKHDRANTYELKPPREE